MAAVGGPVRLYHGGARGLWRGEAVRDAFDAGDVLEGEEELLVAALAVASDLLQEIPEAWLTPLAAAAERLQVTARQMTKYCLAGRVPGAHKRGRGWWVPRDFEILPHPERPRRRKGVT